MKTIIALIAALSLVIGIIAFVVAQSAVHEILAAILILCFVVSTVGLAILDKLDVMVSRKSTPLFPNATPEERVRLAALSGANYGRSKTEADDAWRRAQLEE